MKLVKNVGTVDRFIRILVGIVLVSMAFTGPSNLWFLLGLIPIMTGILGTCPPYQIFGINTCQKK